MEGQVDNAVDSNDSDCPIPLRPGLLELGEIRGARGGFPPTWAYRTLRL